MAKKKKARIKARKKETKPWVPYSLNKADARIISLLEQVLAELKRLN